MTNDGSTSSASTLSAPDRRSAREMLALALGRDTVPAAGTVGDGTSPRAKGTFLPPPLQLLMLSFLMLFVELALICEVPAPQPPGRASP